MFNSTCKALVSVTLLLLSTICLADSITSREIIMNRWFNEAEEVLNKTSDPEFKEMLHFLRDNAVAAEPHVEGARFVGNAQHEQWFAFVPLVKGDEQVGLEWKKFFVEKTAGAFAHDLKALVVNDTIALSSLSRTLVLMHEGFHTKTFIDQPYVERPSDEEYCREEVKAYIFQNRVLSMLGGEKYETLLGKEVVRIVEVDYRTGSFSLLPAGKYNPQIEAVLGIRTTSVFEQELLQDVLWKQAAFLAIDRFFDDEDVVNLKVDFICDSYKHAGVMGE